MYDSIIIRGARLHNLKNITLSIPKNKLVVLTGVSGSGKSTLGFDILLKEGMRQYMEALGMVTFGLAKPPVDAISGLSPTISVDQRLTNQSPRSTVGTSTEVFTYLRVLFARLGHRPCSNCGNDVPPPYDPSNAEIPSETGSDEDSSAPQQTYPCPHCNTPIPVLDMANFSFNKPEGACPTCSGLGTMQQADVTQLVTEQKSILEGAVVGWNTILIDYHGANLKNAARHYGFDFDLSLPVRDYSEVQRDLLFHGVNSPIFRRHFPGIEPPATVRKGRFEGIATNLLRRHAEHIQSHLMDAEYQDKLGEFLITQECPDCDGTRLAAESRLVTVGGQDIVALSCLSLNDLDKWLKGLPSVFSADEMLFAKPILDDMHERLTRLVEVGAGYLTLERASPSLSAGEAQRLRLAGLLGSELSGLLYVFDEPTIGLHPRDTHHLIEVLRRVRDQGNSVLVIEHDLDVIAAADHVFDFGPGAGRHGGQIVASGTPSEIANTKSSITGDYLAQRVSIAIPGARRAPGGKAIIVRGARHHNLQDLTVSFPLGIFVAVTGVSGSGKSSLVFEILDRAIRQHLYGSTEIPGKHDAIDGVENINQIITIDQHHIWRMPRSNAATYTDTFTPIREAFANLPEARRLGFSRQHFSFNQPGGRCERCQGAGVLTVQMHFLPEVEIPCPTCHGRRFTSEILTVKYQGYDIAQVLDMTIEEALALFKDIPAARSRLQVLNDVGLGYLQLGQPATALSGGEAQRIKLARELGRRGKGHTLYMLDEPTTGLHLADIARLLGLLQRLVQAGNSLIVIEHNLEVVKTADWVIDLGPEGGAAGGRLIAEGTPEQVAKTTRSYTGQWLKKILDIRPAA